MLSRAEQGTTCSSVIITSQQLTIRYGTTYTCHRRQAFYPCRVLFSCFHGQILREKRSLQLDIQHKEEVLLVYLCKH